MTSMFTNRRRATKEELEQGEQEMRRGQKRLDEEIAAGTEKPIEDAKRPEVAQVVESPKALEKKVALGSEERPQAAPKSFAPPVPGQSPQDSQEPVAAPKVSEPARSEAMQTTPAEVKSPKVSPKAIAGPQDVPAPASNVVSATKTESGQKGVSNGPQQAAIDSGHQRQADQLAQTPGSQMVSPMPLFDDQQLRRFQELFNQAPWLYPGNMFVPPQMQPLARPLFLEQDERRLGVGDPMQPVSNPFASQSGFQENNDLKRGLELVLEENRKLRERVEALESS